MTKSFVECLRLQSVFLVLPITVLDISQYICIGSIESNYKAQEVGQRYDYLKTFSQNKNLDRLHQFMQTLLGKISLRSPGNDNKIGIDDEVGCNESV